MSSRTNPFAERVNALDEGDFALLQEAVETRRCRESVGVGDYNEAADKWRPRPPCPKCGSSDTVRRARTSAGHRFWECRDCACKYTSLTGTIFESFKKPLFTWVLFIRLMCYNVQLDAAAETLCNIASDSLRVAPSSLSNNRWLSEENRPSE